MNEVLTLEFDGGSRGNPGPAGIGVVVRAADGTALVTLGRAIGVATNNVAEYRALICALEQAKKLGGKRIVVRGDSELIIKQMRGEYRVKHPDMKRLFDEAQHLLHQFDEAKIEHNLRQKNELADKLANLAMDRKGEVTDVNGEVSPPRVSASSGSGKTSLFDREDARARKPVSLVQTTAPATAKRFICPTCDCEMHLIRPPNIDRSKLAEFTCACGSKLRPG